MGKAGQHRPADAGPRPPWVSKPRATMPCPARAPKPHRPRPRTATRDEEQAPGTSLRRRQNRPPGEDAHCPATVEGLKNKDVCHPVLLERR
jgi:hypothetical protein